MTSFSHALLATVLIAGAGAPIAARAATIAALTGDDTLTMPAIGRILEGLPAKARGIVLIEVADASEEQPLETAAAIEIRWLHRQGAAPGTTTLLADAVRAVAFPDDGSRVFAWAAGEFDAFRAIRSHLRHERGLKPGEHLVVSYWRRGKEGEDAEKGQE